MAFFPRNMYNSDASFTPLFRLLDDYDSYSRQSGSPGRRTALPQWQPKFDVREVADAYELHGELPGVAKENVSIEFTEPQTLLIRGKVERTYTAGTPPAGHLEDTTMSGAIADGEAPKSPHKATVEEEGESDARESGSEAGTPASTARLEKKVAKKPADKAKYWLTERSIGEFNRSFNFPSRVDQDEVNASFQDGILTIVVPKAKKHESRRIIVN